MTGTRRDSKGEETTAAISVVWRRRTERPDLEHDRHAARALEHERCVHLFARRQCARGLDEHQVVATRLQLGGGACGQRQAIDQLAANPEDELELKRLKRRRLQLKDCIARLESALIPDEPA